MKNQSDSTGGGAREEAGTEEAGTFEEARGPEGRKPFAAPRLRHEAELVGSTGVAESCAYSTDCTT